MSQSEASFVPMPDAFEVRLKTHRRTVMIALVGELDIATVTQVGHAFDGLNLDPHGFRHVILDLRGLTFMDCTGVHELERQRDAADKNCHNLAVVRGGARIDHLMAMTAIDTSLVLVEHPEDLTPPQAGSSTPTGY